jgi:hypothetical protein
MKKLLALMLSGLLLSATSAYADSTAKGKNNQQNLARQPYQQTPAQDETKDSNFEGATLIDQDAESAKTQKTLQLHRFDRRPYMEKSKD